MKSLLLFAFLFLCACGGAPESVSISSVEGNDFSSTLGQGGDSFSDGDNVSTPPSSGPVNQGPGSSPNDGGNNQTPPTDGGNSQTPPTDGGNDQTPPTDDGNSQNPPMGGNVVGHCAEYGDNFDPKDFDNVIEDFDQTSTLRLVGSRWDNTLVRNCKIHDTSGDGIFLRDVKNVVITNCEIYNIGGHSGIRTSVSGSTSDIKIIGNKIYNTSNNGINLPQRIGNGINSDNAIVANNTIGNTGRSVSDGSVHHIYTQSQGAIISGNYLYGERDGNGISVRSSGRVSCNKIEGSSKARKPGIRYYSDHNTGPDSTLRILRNEVSGQDIGINIFRPVSRYDGASPNGHVVKRFIIEDNVLSNNRLNIYVYSSYDRDPVFSVEIK